MQNKPEITLFKQYCVIKFLKSLFKISIQQHGLLWWIKINESMSGKN